MRGPRILLLVVGLVAVLGWLALRSDERIQTDRGIQETDESFRLVQAELEALQPTIDVLLQQGPALAVREEHDDITSALAELRNRRVAIETRRGADPRQQLEDMRELAAKSDELIAWARDLRRRLETRLAFLQTTTPLLAEARGLRDALSRQDPADEAQELRRKSLASSLGEYEDRAELTLNLMKENVEQGRVMGQTVISGLNTLIEDQKALLAALDGQP